MPGGERDPVLVLVHSPLVGPMTWSRVADELERSGRRAVVPSLLGIARAEAPQWRHAPHAVPEATATIPGSIILVGHSGAGLLLPTIAEALSAEVAALVFVDSFLPPARGDVAVAPPGLMDQMRALASDDVLPPWSSWFGGQAMCELIPDERLRTALVDEMPRLPLSYFDAIVPVPDGWDARPCGYLLFTGEPYGDSAADARRRDWPVAEIHEVQHLAMATAPIAVTDKLLELERALVRRA